MSFRTTLILLVLAAVLGGYVWWFERDEKPDPRKADEVAVFDERFEAADVQKLQIASEGVSLTLERAGDAAWRLASPVSARADRFQADNLARELAELKATRKIAEPSTLASFGLEKPVTRLDVHIAGKSAPRTLLLGDRSVDERSVYAKRADEDSVFLLGTTLLSQVQRKPEDWRDKSLTSIDTGQVLGVEIQREAGRLVLEKQAERWMMVEPMRAPAATEEVEALIREVAGLRVDTFVRDGVTAAELGQYGLTEPRASVRLRVGDTAGAHILFGASEAGEAPGAEPDDELDELDEVTPPSGQKRVYATLADDASVVLVPGMAMQRLGKKAEDFLFLRPFYTAQWQIQRMEVRLDDAAGVVLEKDERGDWKLNEPAGRDVTYGEANGLLGSLYDIRFEPAAEGAADFEEVARVTLTPEPKPDGQATPETVLIGTAGPDGMRPVRRGGEEWVYRMPAAELRPVRDSLAKILGETAEAATQDEAAEPHGARQTEPGPASEAPGPPSEPGVPPETTGEAAEASGPQAAPEAEPPAPAP
jgi:hypothetical protein